MCIVKVKLCMLNGVIILVSDISYIKAKIEFSSLCRRSTSTTLHFTSDIQINYLNIFPSISTIPTNHRVTDYHNFYTTQNIYNHTIIPPHKMHFKNLSERYITQNNVGRSLVQIFRLANSSIMTSTPRIQSGKKVHFVGSYNITSNHYVIKPTIFSC